MKTLLSPGACISVVGVPSRVSSSTHHRKSSEPLLSKPGSLVIIADDEYHWYVCRMQTSFIKEIIIHDRDAIMDSRNIWDEEDDERNQYFLGYRPIVTMNGASMEWLKQNANQFYSANFIKDVPKFLLDQQNNQSNLSSTSTTKTTWLRILEPMSPDTMLSSTLPRGTSFVAIMEQSRDLSYSSPCNPALSVLVNYQPSNEHHPHMKQNRHATSSSPLSVLQQSCLKRQMVGCLLPIFQQSNITTNIILESASSSSSSSTIGQKHPIRWELQIQSVTTTPQESRRYPSRDEQLQTNFTFAMILPSTRITFIMNQSDTMKNKSNEDGINIFNVKNVRSKNMETMLQISPPARILAETIQCCSIIAASISVKSQNVRLSCSKMDVPRGYLFTGPPGVGKTHAVRLAVETTGAHLTVLSGSDIWADDSLSAPQKLELAFVKAVKKATVSSRSQVAVIFLDECDGLLSRESSSSIIMEAMLGTLLDRMNDASKFDWKRLVVVAATNRIDGIPTTLRRPGRFDRELTLLPPDSTARFHILKTMLSMQQSTTDANMDESRVREIADACVGYVPADLGALVNRMRVLRILEQTEKPDDDIELLRTAKSDVGASALRDAALKAPPQTSWDDVAGDPGGAKTALRRAIEWPKRSAYKSFQGLLSPPRGILLHGPPGCAKTTLARAAAGASASSFLSLSPAEVFASSYVGEAEQTIRRAFSLARSAAPCVLFFDEIDAILGSEESSHSGGMGRGSHAEARVLSTFLNEMDGIDNFTDDGVLVLGATNRPWTLDAALLRPGRFDKCIYVPPPDAEGRKSILHLQTCHWPTSIDLDRFVQLTEHMTGAEIVGACRAASMKGIVHSASSASEPQIRAEDLEEEIKNVKPLLSDPRVLWEYKYFDENRKRQTG